MDYMTLDQLRAEDSATDYSDDETDDGYGEEEEERKRVQTSSEWEWLDSSQQQTGQVDTPWSWEKTLSSTDGSRDVELLAELMKNKHIRDFWPEAPQPKSTPSSSPSPLQSSMEQEKQQEHAQEESKLKNVQVKIKEQNSTEDLFYDPDADEKDEIWVRENLRQLRRSDALLSCSGCFTTVCVDSQVTADNRYRTNYVLHSVLSKTKSGEEVLRCELCATVIGKPAASNSSQQSRAYVLYNVLPSAV